MEKIEFPESFAEAEKLIQRGASAYFAGGSYLTAEKSPAVRNLIDVNAIIGREIYRSGEKITIGAGATLQEMIQFFEETDLSIIAECAKYACPSKNIRNQRTLGGEIGNFRKDSELNCCLFALEAALSIYHQGMKSSRIEQWNEDGIIDKIEIDATFIGISSLQRFSLIPSAPAFVIGIGILKDKQINIAIGGKADRIIFEPVKQTNFNEEAVLNLSSSAVDHFTNDQYGSLKYKKQVIFTALNRIGEDLC